MTIEQRRTIAAAIHKAITEAREALPNGSAQELGDWVMTHRHPLFPSDIIEALAREGLENAMREMFLRLERIGVAHYVGPDDRFVILRKPGMHEFQDAALAGGVPVPRDWAQFYEITFGEQPIEGEIIQ